MKIKKYIIVIIIIIIILISLGNKKTIVNNINEYIKVALYGNPIDESTGIINNAYFNIDSTGQDATKTSKGLNKAIQYASKNNIEYIKLQNGIYKINTAIFIKSNINIDLNESEIIFEPASATSYIMINLGNSNNIKISNGKIIGDRIQHDYETIESTHEWGFGIYLKNSYNIEINNLEIMDTIGDGIYILDSGHVTIENNRIHDVRRNGITIISADNVDICNNEIYNIDGTRPKCAIDLERNKSTQFISNIKIYKNKIHNVEGYNILTFLGVSNVEIYENEIWGEIYFKYPNDTIKQHDNIIRIEE